jgi:hypothetical protein
MLASAKRPTNVEGIRLTRAVPAATFASAPVFVAPVQYRPPTIKRITTTLVWHVLIMVRRPSLSVEKDQRATARRLQQLQEEN